jgi:hypothetical protein
MFRAIKNIPTKLGKNGTKCGKNNKRQQLVGLHAHFKAAKNS